MSEAEALPPLPMSLEDFQKLSPEGSDVTKEKLLARKGEALSIAEAIYDQRLTYPELLTPKMIDFLRPYAEADVEPNAYELAPILNALLRRAQGSLVVSEGIRVVDEFTQRLRELEKDIFTFEKKDELSEEEKAALKALREEYQEIEGNRAWAIDYLTRGVGQKITEREKLQTKIEKLEKEAAETEEEEQIQQIQKQIESLTAEAESLKREIDQFVRERNIDDKWLRAYRAFRAQIQIVRTTYQWRRAMQDVKGLEQLFTANFFTELIRPSDMLGLLDMPILGEAVEKAFRGICRLARGKDIGGYKRFLPRESDLKMADVQEFKEKLAEYVSTGHPLLDIWASELAIMLFESSGLSAWFAYERTADGKIVYQADPEKGIETAEEAEKLAYAKGGGGTFFPDRPQDIADKIFATRVKQAKEYGSGNPIGLPALPLVLPEQITTPWLLDYPSDPLIEQIAEGKKTLREVMENLSESSRTTKNYNWFRASQVFGIISQIPISLKGLRTAGEEVMFFLQNIFNLADWKKKIDKAMGVPEGISTEAEREALMEKNRLKMNLVLALLFAVMTDYASPDVPEEKRSVLTEHEQGISSLQASVLDDIKIAVVKSGFLTGEQWGVVKKRLGPPDRKRRREKKGMITKEMVGTLIDEGIFTQKTSSLKRVKELRASLFDPFK